jgi:D-3-phosphoglycerate dehydrogenase
MHPLRILLIDPFPENMLSALRSLNVTVDYAPTWDRARILQELPEVDVLVLNSKINVDAEVASIGKRLRLVCRAGVGMDHFDLDALEKAGIRAFNTPGANADSVAEQTLGMMLSLMHRISRADQQVRRFEWKREPNRGVELLGKTVGVIGYGNTGSAVARKLAGFGCRVLAYDKYKQGFGHSHVTECGIDQLIQESHVLTWHVPLTHETRGWIGADLLGKLPRPVWLLNLSRGSVADLPSLIAALRDGRVLGAALDVLPNEKLQELSAEERKTYEELFALDNVILTPHIGGWSFESLDRINFRIVEEIAALVRETQMRQP